jgi:hypothetical protein
MFFKLVPEQSCFAENVRTLSANSKRFNIAVWLHSRPAFDCEHVRYNGHFFAYMVKGQMGEHRFDLSDVREITFWPKRERE